MAASVRERGVSKASAMRVAAVAALLALVALGRGPQTLRLGWASGLGLLNGVRESDSPLDQGVVLGGVSVLELPAIPASHSRLTIVVEAVRDREIELACPDGAPQRVSLAADTPSTVTCVWPAERGGHVEITRTAGRGRVIARSMTFEPAGLRLGLDHARWLTTLALLAWWFAWTSGGRRWMATAILFLLGASAMVLAPRVEVLDALSRLWYLVVIVEASRIASARAEHWSAGVLGFAVLAKLAFAASGYGGADTAFHVHRLSDFINGQVQTRSVAPGLETPLPVPYPPGVYALLSPIGVMVDESQHPRVVGVALWAGEVISAFLTIAIARKAGLSPGAAWTAGALYAILPEGVLVMFKGILANVFGQAAALLAALSLVPPISRVGLSIGMALVFLAHLGVTLNLLIFLGVWAWWATPAERRLMSHSFVPAALAAWLLYYRGAFGVALEAVEQVSGNLLRPATVVAQVPLIRIAKIVQNVFLKLGGLPLLPLANRDPWPEGPRRLFKAMFATYLIAAAFAIASPVTLRFELFAAPAFCLFAASMLDDRRAKRLTALVGVLSLVLFGLLSGRRFDIINVILESPRWPLFRDLTSL